MHKIGCVELDTKFDWMLFAFIESLFSWGLLDIQVTVIFILLWFLFWVKEEVSSDLRKDWWFYMLG